jgi:hypothetical protein
LNAEVVVFPCGGHGRDRGRFERRRLRHMTEATEPREGARASELPSKYLPGVEYRDLPEPVSVWKIVGASAIITATAMGSGEFILWPLIVSQVGFTIFWACILGFFFQYILNMEIERYALVTGETAVTGFARLWRHWGSSLYSLRSCLIYGLVGPPVPPRL